MATTNPVNQVLVTSGDQAVLAAGSRPDALAVGQVGFFNMHTGLSIDGTVGADAKDVYIAVGIDPLGVGSLQDINKSAGQMIQVRNAKSLTWRGYQTPLPKIIDISGFTAKCETDYVVKVEFRNGQIYHENGYNQFTKSFNYRTSCCTDSCEPCASGNCAELSTGLASNINADLDSLVTASYFVNRISATIAAEPTAAGNIVVTIGTTAYTVAIVDADTVTTAAAKVVAVVNSQADSPYFGTNTAGLMYFYPKKSINGSTETLVYTTTLAGLTITPIVAATKTVVSDSAAFIAAVPGVCLGIRLTSNPMAINAYNGINLQYVKNRETDIIVSLTEGFACNGDTTVVQNLRRSEGSGYDIQQIEYIAGGWNGKPGPYRVSDTAVGVDRGIVYFASKTGTYGQFILTYDILSVGGWEEYLNNIQTIIAIPCADTTTSAGIATVLDAIFTQFGAMTGDVSANGDCTNAATSTLTAATDGIESLA